MKKKFLSIATMAFILFTGTWFTSCDDDDDSTDVSEGNSVISIENVTTMKDFVQSGMFQNSATEPVIKPGQSLSFKFYAGKGQALMFATMYGNSNDIFFAPENPGIKLFNDNGTAITGDVSSQIFLWDNGTRINQAPGANVSHPGTAEVGTVTKINGNDAQGNSYLAASALMRATLAFNSSTSEFTFTINNISTGSANETPFSPGVWVVSNVLGGDLVNDKPFFTQGEKSTDQLTALAETGNNKPLGDMVTEETGIITGVSPMIVVVYSGNTNPIFEVGKKDAGQGLKTLAQTGNTTPLKESLEKLRNVRQVFVVGTEPIAPGKKQEISFEAWEGYNIAYATMFGYSNDWFYANNATIASGFKGDITSKTSLYDNGTGIDQYPGAGNNQALFEGTPVVEDKVISTVGNTYPVPEVSKMIKVVLR